MTARVTAATMPIVLEIPDEPDRTVTYQMAPLSDKDQDELDLWVQYRCMELARKSLPPEARDYERQELLKAAIAQAQSMCWSSGSGLQTLDTPAGRARMLWQSLRKTHPNVTEEQLRPYFRYMTNISRLFDTYREINGISPPKNSESASEQTTQSAAD